MERIQLSAPCLFGLEGILASELRRMGAEDVRPDNGRVDFAGGLDMLCRANLGSRFAERIQIELGRFPAKTFDQLFEGVKGLPWEQWIGKKDAFPVKGWALESKLYSVPDCQSIVKKAVVERLKQKYGVDWFEETGAVHQIQFSIHKNQASLYLDTSGAGLHKRGYRPAANQAPIRETLAAAMADLAHVRGYSHVFDPMCGSGTLLIESALIALRIAPGLSRHFAAEKWEGISQEIWRSERQRAIGMIIRDNEFEAFGSDIDAHSLELTLENAHRAGVKDRIRVRKQDVRDFVPEGGKGTVLCNPPYGERLLDMKEAEDLYRILGQRFVKKEGWSYYIISPHDQFEQLFGSKADKRRKLYNGMIKCQYYMYFKDSRPIGKKNPMGRQKG